MLDGHGDDAEALVIDASLKLHAKSLRKVLEASDVIVEVLDARDPVGTRCRAVERELKSLDGGRKKLVLVLNKIGEKISRIVPAFPLFTTDLYFCRDPTQILFHHQWFKLGLPIFDFKLRRYPLNLPLSNKGITFRPPPLSLLPQPRVLQPNLY